MHLDDVPCIVLGSEHFRVGLWRDLFFDMDDAILVIQPDNVDGESHILHPYAMSSVFRKGEEHDGIRIKGVSVAEAPSVFPGFIGDEQSVHYASNNDALFSYGYGWRLPPQSSRRDRKRDDGVEEYLHRP